MINTLNKVVTDFSKASVPASEVARKIAKAASETIAKGKSGIKGLATGRSDTFRVNPYLLKIQAGWNARVVDSPENQDHIDSLALSIAANGVQEALTAYWDGGEMILTDGHCRLLATFRAIEVYGAEIFSIPVQTENKGANEGDRLMSQIIRNSGKPLTPLEMASVFKRLSDFGWSIEEIARRSALSGTRVTQLLDLQGAPQAIKDMIIAGKVSSTLAIQTVKSAKSEKEAVETLEKAVSTAKENGRGRATAKHVSEGKDSFKKIMKAKIEAEQVYIDNSDEDGDVEISMKLTKEEYAAFLSHFKIKP